MFDDEIDRLAEEYGSRHMAPEIAETDHELLRFYLPPEARRAVIAQLLHLRLPTDGRLFRALMTAHVPG